MTQLQSVYRYETALIGKVRYCVGTRLYSFSFVLALVRSLDFLSLSLSLFFPPFLLLPTLFLFMVGAPVLVVYAWFEARTFYTLVREILTPSVVLMTYSLIRSYASDISHII